MCDSSPIVVSLCVWIIAVLPKGARHQRARGVFPVFPTGASDSYGIVDAEIQGRFQGQAMTIDTTTMWAVESDGESWLVNETLLYSQDADVQGRRVTFAIGSSNTPAPTMLPSNTTTQSPTDPGNRTRTTPSPTPSPYDPVPKPSKLNLATVSLTTGPLPFLSDAPLLHF